MNRTELGMRLQQWHSSMNDPVYAVGSFYFSGKVYPDKEVVEDCLSNLTKEINQKKRMLAGEKVVTYNSHLRCTVEDLRTFAGYTDEELNKDIEDLEEIVSELQVFMIEDYTT